MPEPIPPYVQLTVEVSLPDSATDEQREAFRRAMEAHGASPQFAVIIGLPSTATPEERERFGKALQETFPDFPVLDVIDTKPIDR
ncbi:MAG TPA: hypothetical protein VL283_03805 [Candidatus Baltobacteraceae bacterium]|nr:hypothetical protein [Candidatus Baltobacteraceae bacterium]